MKRSPNATSDLLDGSADRMGKISPWTVIAVLAIVALGFSLRVFRLYDQSYWGDEVNGIVITRNALWNILDWIKASGEPHPPLWYVILQSWVRLVGENELATRFVSAAFGTLSLPLMFVLGRALLSTRFGLAGALLLATNPLNVLQSRDLRMYAIVVCLTLLATVVMLLCLRRQDFQRVLMASYVAICLIGLFLHYYFAFVLASHALFLAVVLRQRLWLLKRWLVVWIAIAVVYSPWLFYAGSVLVGYEGYTWSPTRLGIDTLAQAFWSVATEFSGATRLGNDRWQVYATGFVCALLLVGLASWIRRAPVQGLLLTLAFLVPILSAYGASLRRSIFLPKYLIAASPAFLLVIVGVMFLLSTRRRWASVLPALLLVPMLATNTLSLTNSYFDPNLANPDYRSAAKLVRPQARDGDGFVFGHWGVKLQFTYYYGYEPIHYLPPGSVAGHEAEIEATLAEVLKHFDRVWFVPYWKSDIDLFIEDWLDRHAFKSQNEFAGKIKVILYSSPRNEDERALLANPTRFGNGLVLEAATIGSRAIESGSSYNLKLDWYAPKKIGENLKAALRLTDESGYVYSLVDRRLMDQATADWWPGQRTRENRGLLVAPGTPPGEYRVELVLYREQDGRSVDFADGDGVSRSGVLQLGRVQVARSTIPTKPEAIPLPRLVNADANEDIRLLGASIGRSNVKPGERVPVTIYWQAKRDVSTDYSIALKAIGERGTAGETAFPAAAGRYPTTRWVSGEIVRDHYELSISPKAATGKYNLIVGLAQAEQRGDTAIGKEINIGALAVKAKERRFDLPTPSYPVTSDFGRVVRLLGYDLAMGDNQQPTLTLYWQALQEMDVSYTVFVHLLDGGERVWGQSDGVPATGLSPTTGWVAGEVTTDRHVVPFRAEAPGGRYLIEVGLYDAASGARLKRETGEDRIILQEVSRR